MKIILNLFAVISLVTASGCTTISTARKRDHDAALRAELYALKARVEGMEQGNEQMFTQFDAIRSEGNESGRSIQQQISDLRSDIENIKNSQQSLKAAIVSEISTKMASLMSEQAKTAPVGEVGRYHKVAAGETLSAIASAYNSRVDLIVKANSLKNANAIRVGQKLFIPE